MYLCFKSCISVPDDGSSGPRYETFIDDIIKSVLCLSVVYMPLLRSYVTRERPNTCSQILIVCNNGVADAGTSEKRPTPAILNVGYWCDIR